MNRRPADGHRLFLERRQSTAATTDLKLEERAVTTKNDFTEDEWSRIVRAPFVAGMAISLADPGGPIEATKETMATLRTATNPPSREQLLTEVALELQAMAQERRNPLSGYRPSSDGPPPGEQVLEELRAVQALVARTAEPEEAAAFGRWLVTAAQAAADAAKEGGFLGIGAQQVSEREQAMLDQVRAAVSG
jgi:hypothetical protein